jgi:hypothetical protein
MVQGDKDKGDEVHPSQGPYGEDSVGCSVLSSRSRREDTDNFCIISCGICG